MCAVCATAAAAECKEPRDCRRATASPAGLLWHTPACRAHAHVQGQVLLRLQLRTAAAPMIQQKVKHSAAKEQQVRDRVRACKVLASTGTRARTHMLQLHSTRCRPSHSTALNTAACVRRAVHRSRRNGCCGSINQGWQGAATGVTRQQGKVAGHTGQHSTAFFQKCAASAH